MINYKVLLKAMSFMFLPTISVLFVIFMGFFSVSKFIAFITSDNGWAIFVRIVLVIAEIVFVYLMYKHYHHEYRINNAESSKGAIIKDNEYRTAEYYYFGMDGYGDYRFRSYKTNDKDIILLERFKK